MMSYNDHLQLFKKELRQVIDNYQICFKSKPIPVHRANDITALLGEIENNNHDDETLKAGIMGVLTVFKTGIRIFKWWVYKTGDSRLAEGLLIVLDKKIYSREAFTRSQIYELKLQLTQLRERESSFTFLKESENASEALIKAQETISTLSKDNARLEQDNQNLRAELKRIQHINMELYNKNQQIRQENQNLQKRLEIGDFNNDSMLSTSPSDSLSNSFKSYGKFAIK